MPTRLKYPKIATVIRQGGYNASRTSMDLPISRDRSPRVEGARAAPVVQDADAWAAACRCIIITDTLNAPTIGIPIANHDNNQHGENENIRLQNLWDGIEMMAALLTMK